MEHDSKSGADGLERQGWVRQFVASEPRLSEAVALYKESGFEVHLEPYPNNPDGGTCSGPEPGDRSECRTCFKGFEDRYKIIYTRPARRSETP